MKLEIVPAVLAFLALTVFTSHSQALPPQPSTPAPYIVTSDTLDEPNGFGFCFDTYGRGQTDILHTHSCKPTKEGVAWDDRDNDIRFSMDPKTGSISPVSYTNICVQVLIAANVSVFALLECSDNPRQRFSYDAVKKTLSLQKDPTRCVAVGPKTLPAPPFVRRPLELVSCDSVPAARKQWTIVTE